MTIKTNELKTKIKGAIMEVTLDRPKANAIDLLTSQRMGEIFMGFRDNPKLRVAILRAEGEKFFTAGWDLKAAADGDGAVDAAYNAIKKLIDIDVDLKLYSVNNITSGTDAQGEVTVRVVKDDLIVNGHGADTDIVKASVLAYLNAINKIFQNPDLKTKKLPGI